MKVARQKAAQAGSPRPPIFLPITYCNNNICVLSPNNISLSTLHSLPANNEIDEIEVSHHIPKPAIAVSLSPVILFTHRYRFCRGLRLLNAGGIGFLRPQQPVGGLARLATVRSIIPSRFPTPPSTIEHQLSIASSEINRAAVPDISGTFP